MRKLTQAIVVLSIALTAVCPLCADGGPGPDTKRFGAATPGGSGGRVIRVTSLDADGPGSLRDALRQTGPRIVVFEVGGVIDLGGRTLTISEPFLTVAGQTSPGHGITLIRGGISIVTHDVVVKHIRVRPGDAGKTKGSGWEPDGLSTSGADAYNIVIDHCSFSWAVDENLSASGPRAEGPEKTSRCITFSNNLIAEALSQSTHAKGEHSKGTLIHDNCRHIAITGNIYAHNVDRNPRFKAATTGVVVNNLIYNPGSSVMNFGAYAPEWIGLPPPADPTIAVVGNVLMAGPSTRVRSLVSGSSARLYLKDNIIRSDDREIDLISGNITRLSDPPVWPEGLEAAPAEGLYPGILSTAGARPAERDAIDLRIIESIRTGQGRVIDSQDEVGGYPEYALVRRALDIPEGDIDAWLDRLAREVETPRADKPKTTPAAESSAKPRGSENCVLPNPGASCYLRENPTPRQPVLSTVSRPSLV